MAADRIIWMHIGATKLVPSWQSPIMEVALIVTDKNLNSIGMETRVVLSSRVKHFNLPRDYIARHRGWGLLEESSHSKLTLTGAEDVLLKYVRAHTEYGKSPLGGVDIRNMRLLLRHDMKRLHEHCAPLDYESSRYPPPGDLPPRSLTALKYIIEGVKLA